MIKNFIIDTNVLVQYPEVLAMAAGNNLVIPMVVLEQFQQRRLRGVNGGVQEIIDEAIKKGVHVAESPPHLIEEPVASGKDAQRLDHVDLEIARVVKYYAERDGKTSVCLVTADQLLAKFLEKYEIKSISGTQFLKGNPKAKVDKDIEKTAKNIISKQQRYLILSFVLGIVVALLGSLVFNNLQLLISTISTNKNR